VGATQAHVTMFRLSGVGCCECDHVLGLQISPFYDSLVAKLMVWAPTREAAIQKMQAALAQTRLRGVPNNLEFLQHLVKVGATLRHTLAEGANPSRGQIKPLE